jgi:hypothetical protein
VDLVQASYAQSLIEVYTPSDPDSVKPTLDGNTIVVIRGPLPLEALSLMGLTTVPTESTLWPV